jgi:DNA-directed RNA polymerase II subunit RPB11
MPQVLFAGYKVPHPLHPYFLVKIQTDGTITPTAALEQACTKLIGTLSSLEAKFKREFSFKDVEGVATEDSYGTSNAGPTWASGRDYMSSARFLARDTGQPEKIVFVLREWTFKMLY